MRQLLSELSQTRRLAEDLITRLEHNKRNDSPASTGGKFWWVDPPTLTHPHTHRLPSLLRLFLVIAPASPKFPSVGLP